MKVVREKLEFVWACGLFEGEGTVLFYQHGSSTKRALICVQKNPEALYRLQAAFGCGKVYPRADLDIEMYYWQVAKWEDLEPLLTRMLPWLCSVRREKALAMLADPPLVRKKGHCFRGHKMSGDNLYVSPKGKRWCRKCLRDRRLGTIVPLR